MPDLPINQMVFKNKKLATDFISLLFEIDSKDKDHYCDIHCYQEEKDVYVVEWTQIGYKYANEVGKFKYVDADEMIGREIFLPDGSCRTVDATKVDQYLNLWLKQHPEYKENN